MDKVQSERLFYWCFISSGSNILSIPRPHLALLWYITAEKIQTVHVTQVDAEDS